MLAKAYQNGPATCLCQSPVIGQRQLAIKPRRSANQYSIARYAHSGQEHILECRFYSEAISRSGRQVYAEGAREEDGEEGWWLRLERGIDASVLDRLPAALSLDGIDRTTGSTRALTL